MTQRMEEPGYALGAAVLIVADDPQAATDARDAVAFVGARTVGCIAWGEVAERLERQGTLSAIVAEATAVGAETVEQVLPRLGALTLRDGARMVVTFGGDQIDLVAAQLLGEGAELLCTPSIADRVAALSVALTPRSADRLHEAGREGEAVRLRRLNEEVARIAETLARLSRDNGGERMARAASVADRVTGYGAPPPVESPGVSPREIRAAIRARRLRDRIIPGGLFEDPAWDMLLDLTAADLERAQVSVSSLCIAAAVAPTTALRWIGKLTDAGLIERQPDPFDRRRAFMVLTESAREGMRRYLATVRQEGLPIA